jgi:hypothetical protein
MGDRNCGYRNLYGGVTMTDREPKYPGRVKLKDVETGVEKVYDMVMADEPLEAGTPPTKPNLFSDTTAALYPSGTDTVDKALAYIPGMLQYYKISENGPSSGSNQIKVVLSGISVSDFEELRVYIDMPVGKSSSLRLTFNEDYSTSSPYHYFYTGSQVWGSYISLNNARDDFAEERRISIRSGGDSCVLAHVSYMQGPIAGKNTMFGGEIYGIWNNGTYSGIRSFEVTADSGETLPDGMMIRVYGVKS